MKSISSTLKKSHYSFIECCLFVATIHSASKIKLDNYSSITHVKEMSLDKRYFKDFKIFRRTHLEKSVSKFKEQSK